MRTAEKNLLIAVRDRLRTQLVLQDHECEVEYDEMTAAVKGHRCFVVLTGGWQPGPRHRTSGGVNDLIYGVSVLVIRRSTHVPRDRQRNVFIGNLGDLTDEIDKVYEQVDFNYPLLTAANALIETDTGSTEGFTEPLKFSGIDQKPRIAPAEIFGGTGGKAGLMRAIHFHGARRLTHK